MNSLEFNFLENLLQNGIIPAVQTTKHATFNENVSFENSNNLLNLLFDENVCSIQNLTRVLDHSFFQVKNYEKSGKELNSISFNLELESLSFSEMEFFKHKCYQYIIKYMHSNEIFNNSDNDCLELKDDIKAILFKLFNDDIFTIFKFLLSTYIYFKNIKYIDYSDVNTDVEAVNATKLLKLLKVILIEFFYKDVELDGIKLTNKVNEILVFLYGKN